MGWENILNKHIRANYFAERRAARLKHFKEKPNLEKDNLEVKGIYTLRLPREHVDGRSSEEVYIKQTLTLPQAGQKLDIITNQNLTHDTTLLLHTNGSKVKELLAMGLLNPQALTSKAIKALGKYRKKVWERQIKSSIVSEQSDKKEALLVKAQKRIEDLQEIELRLGQRIEQATSKQATGEDFVGQINLDLFVYSRHAEDQDDKEAAKALQDLLVAHRQDVGWLQTTGNQEILSFLKERTLLAVRQLQGENQILTHQQGSKAYLRGDLNSVCEDAIKLVRDHRQDFHTPLSLDHQLRYAATDAVCVDSDFHTDGSLEQLEDLLLGVSVVGGNNSPLAQHPLRGKLRKTSAVKWRHWHSFYDFNKPHERSSFSSWQGFGNWCCSILLSPLNLVETALRGNEAHFFMDLRARLLRMQQSEGLTLRQDQTDFYALTARLNKETGISTKIGLEIYKALNYLFVQGLWKGLVDGWKQIKRLPDDLQADFRRGEEPLATTLDELRQALNEIQTHDNQILGETILLVHVKESSIAYRKIANHRALYPHIPILMYENGRYSYMNTDDNVTRLEEKETDPFQEFDFNKGDTQFLILARNSPALLTIQRALKPSETGLPLESKATSLIPREEEKKQEDLVYAQPALSLHPYTSHGVLNGAASGFVEFIDLFGHNMFAKHPLTGTISAAGVVVSFMAFYSPALATQLFGKGYVKFLRDQGFIWSKDVFSASLAGSFTNFKLMGALVEGLEHGPDGWLNKALSHLANDPAKTITYITFSWLIGHSLVYWLEVPGLSDELRKHIGSPPALSEIFGGAKLGLIASHLFATPLGDHLELRKNYIDECMVNYRESQGKRGTPPTEEQEAQVRTCFEEMLSLENIQKIRGQLQAERDRPKSPEENKLALLLLLATHKEKLPRLTPELRAKLQAHLGQSGLPDAEVTSIDKYLDPDSYAPKSTLRSFIGRGISYFPTLFRCVLSLFAGVLSCVWRPLAKALGCPVKEEEAWFSLKRPWKELGSMLLDDLTSTTFAIFRVVNKVVESLFNRLPRTLGDIVFNGFIARTLSLFGYHQPTRFGYRMSAKFDQLQERVCESTTGGIMTYLAHKNTSPHAEVGLSYALKEKMKGTFDALPVRPSPLPLPNGARGPEDKVQEEKSPPVLPRPEIEIQQLKSLG